MRVLAVRDATAAWSIPLAGSREEGETRNRRSAGNAVGDERNGGWSCSNPIPLPGSISGTSATTTTTGCVSCTLDAGDEFTLDSDDESVTLAPPGRVEFEFEVERETSSGGSSEIELGFELEWNENATDTGDLTTE